MSETTVMDHSPAVPDSLRPMSLLKRAVVGLLTLVFGIMIGAWLLHSSIQVTDASETTRNVGSLSSAQHTISRDQ